MGKKSEQPKDIRLAATTRIWGFTLGILAISVPLSIPLRNSLIPLAALTGATVGTLAVWRSEDKKSKGYNLAPQQVELLEQRIRDLEAIVSTEDYDLKSRLKHLDSKSL
ncbi:hypothetical protein DSM106972_065220 [Dulcicalothrix desertica PCC 7102]|uniref:Uncharacterized protein n=1 Tax=Dulcicalothrix desertica PCC 7102 TaxID=232991 RepID=A0A3S1CFV5_9CYAN|nr:hypothetical protein [Dulcicalothrix desertica]RUT01899.1 hypothetical protein DSM106972_065220 [Dulcicalothrix desertica PCC 7102]TWH43051.1 hypothetical protein CAL7102_06745 [Dulcicalothrix desertica PCC 7102]